jgi:uncharacterized membrane protein YgdD (TMEM256/DUF423 family)
MHAYRRSIVIGALSGASAVALGAFGAHALRAMLDERALATWHTAVEYQFWHALALLAVGLLVRERISTTLRFSAVAFIVGSVLFCGSLYALALGAPRWIGVITPIGGVAFMAGWVALALHAWREIHK